MSKGKFERLRPKVESSSLGAIALLALAGLPVKPGMKVAHIPHRSPEPEYDMDVPPLAAGQQLVHTRRVYSNAEYVDNWVHPEHLKEHVEYNTTMRFGCAFFVSGECVNKGYLSEEDCDVISRQLRKDPPKNPGKCKLPYR